VTKTYAVVKNGAVENMVVWDGVRELSIPDSELILADSNARIGGSWDGSSFSFVEPEDTRTYADKRKAEYPSIDELVVALWEGVVEERMAAVTSLEGKRQAVKTKYPK
jgi:hypothetical protein